jgi:LysM repeat protein
VSDTSGGGVEGAAPAAAVINSGPRANAIGAVVGNVYTIAPGDTFYSIGLRFGLPWQDIAASNNTNQVIAGQQLIIPELK